MSFAVVNGTYVPRIKGNNGSQGFIFPNGAYDPVFFFDTGSAAATAIGSPSISLSSAGQAQRNYIAHGTPSISLSCAGSAEITGAASQLDRIEDLLEIHLILDALS